MAGCVNTNGTLSISDEDKNGKGATVDSVQQRRQYRRQNQESSSGVEILILIPPSSVPCTSSFPFSLQARNFDRHIQSVFEMVYLVLDTGSSSSEDEGPTRPTAGPSARNGEVRRRRSRTPSPRRRHRDVSPRSGKLKEMIYYKYCTLQPVKLVIYDS